MFGRAFSFFFGLTAGAASAMLVAPRSGKDTRGLIRSSASGAVRNMRRRSSDQKRGVIKALEAGSRAYRQAVGY